MHQQGDTPSGRTTVAEAGAERDRTSRHGDGEQPSGSAAGAESRGTFSALRYRNFRVFFFGQLISLTGTWMDITAEGWLVYKLTGSKLLLGVVGVAGSAPLLLFSIWGGWLADHYPKRTVIVLTQSVSMVLAFILSSYRVAGRRPALAHHFDRISVRHRPGVRYARAPIFFHRDDQPG